MDQCIFYRSDVELKRDVAWPGRFLSKTISLNQCSILSTHNTVTSIYISSLKPCRPRERQVKCIPKCEWDHPPRPVNLFDNVDVSNSVPYTNRHSFSTIRFFGLKKIFLRQPSVSLGRHHRHQMEHRQGNLKPLDLRSCVSPKRRSRTLCLVTAWMRCAFC
jgi:hypothetical protein